MAVLVTGGAGYIGSHMLLDAGEDVVVLDRLSTGFDWAVAPEAELVVGDIADQDLVEPMIRRRGIDAIMHFAGSIMISESVGDPLGYYLNNTARSRVTGRDLDVRIGGRRHGDLAAVIANAELARAELGWKPRLDDMDKIVSHALAWEEALKRRNS